MHAINTYVHNSCWKIRMAPPEVQSFGEHKHAVKLFVLHVSSIQRQCACVLRYDIQTTHSINPARMPGYLQQQLFLSEIIPKRERSTVKNKRQPAYATSTGAQQATPAPPEASCLSS